VEIVMQKINATGKMTRGLQQSLKSRLAALVGNQVKTAEYPPFEKGGLGGFKKVASAATVKSPSIPLLQRGRLPVHFAFMRFTLTNY
jgi:hypothetical protein